MPYIMGKNCIKELLSYHKERFLELYTDKIEDPLALEAKQKKIPVKKLTKEQLTKLVESSSHQSFVGKIKERKAPLLEEMENKNFIILLDRIYDPQNFGAILRAAECFSVDAVIFSKNRGCKITPVVSKASCGASELVPIIQVSNLSHALRWAKGSGFCVITTAGEGETSLEDFVFPEKCLLILGSEGEGVQELLRNLSDVRLKIPLYGKITSLNVSQAASVILSHWKIKPT